MDEDLFKILKSIESLLECQVKLLKGLVEKRGGRGDPDATMELMENLVFKNLRGIVPNEILDKAVEKAKEVNKR